MRRRILIVAAERFELLPIRKAVAARSDCEFVLVANGPGPRLASKAIARASANSDFDLYVSTGLCGGLRQDLRVGTVVIGTSINGVEIAQPRCGHQMVSGPIASVDRVISTREERRELSRRGAVAVEMEAAAVLDCAERSGKPCYCVKAVSDTASESFHVDLNAARDGEGRFSVLKILGQALRAPRTAFPELMRLRRNSLAAATALGEFFANCNL
ncbi:MAG TPA: hypothetical protein VEQ63_09470 [Bryobacteraceae bacterium]|nr:hypothetical protein [Bryobacteraceae bacterium]